MTLSNSGDGRTVTSTGMLRTFKSRKQFFQWMRLPVVMFTIGIVLSMEGPTFLDLQIITGTKNKETASLFITSGSCGYLAGALLAGFLYDKLNTKRGHLMSIPPFLAGGLTILLPFCCNFPLMVMIEFVSMSAYGCIETTSNAEHMRMWSSDGQSLLQLVHSLYAWGGLVGPLLAEPFIAKREKTNRSAIVPLNVSVISNPSRGQSLTELKYNEMDMFVSEEEVFNGTIYDQEPLATKVHVAYLIGGLIIIVSSLPFIGVGIEAMDPRCPPEENLVENLQSRKLPVKLHAFILLLICVLTFMYSCPKKMFSSCLPIFLLDRYEEITSSEGAYATTLFWGSFAAGRAVSILTSKYISPVRILYVHLTLTIVACVGFTLGAISAKFDVMTLFICVTGLALGPVYATSILWAETEVVNVTGRIAAAFQIGYSLGSAAFPYLLGYLIEHVSNLWFCYITLGSSVATVFVFLTTLILNRCYINKKYGTVGEGKTIEQFYGTFDIDEIE